MTTAEALLENDSAVCLNRKSGLASAPWLETGATALAMAGLVILPLLALVLRPLIHVGLDGGNAIVQHLVLIVGMVGAAMAAREGRLIALSNLEETLFRGRLLDASHVLTAAASTSISALLLPPCLPLILYAIVAKVPMNQMFLAGLLPTAVMMTAIACWDVWRSRNNAPSQEPFEAWKFVSAVCMPILLGEYSFNSAR